MIPRFRAWDEKHRQWARIGDSVSIADDGDLFPHETDYVIEQSTGYLSEEGTESWVFDGDICSFTYTGDLFDDAIDLIGVVEYSEGDAAWYLLIPTRGVSVMLGDTNIIDVKVIGNIHEHPHLLEAGEK